MEDKSTSNSRLSSVILVLFLGIVAKTVRDEAIYSTNIHNFFPYLSPRLALPLLPLALHTNAIIQVLTQRKVKEFEKRETRDSKLLLIL